MPTGKAIPWSFKQVRFIPGSVGSVVQSIRYHETITDYNSDISRKGINGLIEKEPG
jgi:hypothetical protein